MFDYAVAERKKQKKNKSDSWWSSGKSESDSFSPMDVNVYDQSAVRFNFADIPIFDPTSPPPGKTAAGLTVEKNPVMFMPVAPAVVAEEKSNVPPVQMQTDTEAETEKAPNLTGIPDDLKVKFERNSGFSFADVQVFYNSDDPARIGALAYTQGNRVHIGPGQEEHLAHELGHVVQQKQGRVRVTGYVAGEALNDDKELEKKADDQMISNSVSQVATEPIIQRLAYYADSAIPNSIGAIPKIDQNDFNKTEKDGPERKKTQFLPDEQNESWKKVTDETILPTSLSGAGRVAINNVRADACNDYYFASWADMINYGQIKAGGARETMNVVNVGQGTMVLHTVRTETNGAVEKKRLLSDLGPNLDNLLLMLVYKKDSNLYELVRDHYENLAVSGAISDLTKKKIAQVLADKPSEPPSEPPSSTTQAADTKLSTLDGDGGIEPSAKQPPTSSPAASTKLETPPDVEMSGAQTQTPPLTTEQKKQNIKAFIGALGGKLAIAISHAHADHTAGITPILTTMNPPMRIGKKQTVSTLAPDSAAMDGVPQSGDTDMSTAESSLADFEELAPVSDVSGVPECKINATSLVLYKKINRKLLLMPGDQHGAELFKMLCKDPDFFVGVSHVVVVSPHHGSHTGVFDPNSMSAAETGGAATGTGTDGHDSVMDASDEGTPGSDSEPDTPVSTPGHPAKRPRQAEGTAKGTPTSAASAATVSPISSSRLVSYPLGLSAVVSDDDEKTVTQIVSAGIDNPFNHPKPKFSTAVEGQTVLNTQHLQQRIGGAVIKTSNDDNISPARYYKVRKTGIISLHKTRTKSDPLPIQIANYPNVDQYNVGFFRRDLLNQRSSVKRYLFALFNNIWICHNEEETGCKTELMVMWKGTTATSAPATSAPATSAPATSAPATQWVLDFDSIVNTMKQAVYEYVSAEPASENVAKNLIADRFNLKGIPKNTVRSSKQPQMFGCPTSPKLNRRQPRGTSPGKDTLPPPSP
ncbi:MAG: DUF4157 domain-containing protein [Nitrososphaerota archaeon]|jgi:hypothetical protein|nr:DUF4157 domain-containing protein [Nitrososphaerota archaeon]